MIFKHNYSRFLFLHLCGLLFLYGPIILAGNSLYFRDINLTYHPQLEFIRTSFLTGQWPFWNPTLLLGSPLMAALEPPIFYPLNWIFVLPLSFSRLLGLNLLLHHLIAASGMYVLGQRLQWRDQSILFASLSFSLGGFLVGMNNIHPVMNTVAWIPLIFWATHAICHEKKVRAAGVFAVVYALQILSGHLDIVFAQSLAILIYAGCLILRYKSFKAFILMSSATVVGILLGMVQLWPSLKYAPFTARHQGVQLEQSQLWSFHPAHLVQLLLPEMPRASEYNHAWHNIFNEHYFAGIPLIYSFYLGVLGCLLLLYALYRQRAHVQRLDLIVFIATGFVLMLIALGKHFHLYALLYEAVPGFSYFRYPVKYFSVSYFVLCVCVGFGFERLAQDFDDGESSALKVWMALGSALFCLSLLLYVGLQQEWIAALLQRYRGDLSPVSQLQLSQEIFETLRGQCKHIALISFLGLLGSYFWLYRTRASGAYLLASVLALDLVASGINLVWMGKETTDPPQVLPVVQPLLKSERHNYRILNHQIAQATVLPEAYRPDLVSVESFRVSQFQYDFLQPDIATAFDLYQVFSYWQGMSAQIDAIKAFYYLALEQEAYSLLYALEALMGAKYILLAAPSEALVKYYQQSPGYTVRHADALNQFMVLEHQAALPRARFQTQGMIVKSKEMAQHAIIYPKDSGFDFQKHVVLERDSALEQALKEVPVQEAANKKWSTPQILSEDNQSLRLAFETNSSGYLVLADQNLPGWTAYDNGKPVPILAANYLMRAVRVGPGQHEIEFRYTPPGLLLGLALSCLGGLFCLFLFFLPVLFQKRNLSGAS